MIKNIEELKEYDLELERIIEEVNRNKARRILLQFPDGLKPYAAVIVQELEKKCSAEFFIWLGSCYGACDIPNLNENLKIDLLVQFGHSVWK